MEVHKTQAAGVRSLLQRRRRRKGKGQDEAWLQHHQQLVKEVEEADKGSGFDVIFYGDSIMESTRCLIQPVLILILLNLQHVVYFCGDLAHNERLGCLGGRIWGAAGQTSAQCGTFGWRPLDQNHMLCTH